MSIIISRQIITLAGNYTSGQVGPKSGESIWVVHIVIIENVLVLVCDGVISGCVYLVNGVGFIRLHFHAPVYQGSNVEAVSFVGLGGVFIARVLFQVVLQRKERSKVVSRVMRKLVCSL